MTQETQSGVAVPTERDAAATRKALGTIGGLVLSHRAGVGMAALHRVAAGVGVRKASLRAIRAALDLPVDGEPALDNEPSDAPAPATNAADVDSADPEAG